jgi:hypothetical protein
MDKKIILGFLALIVLILAAYYVGEGSLFKPKESGSATGNVSLYVLPKNSSNADYSDSKENTTNKAGGRNG